MTFRTRLDYSDNRQIKQRERTNTILSGTTVFGVPFSALTSGPDLSYTAQTSQFFGVVSTYSGDSATTVFTWGIPNVSIVDPYISALTPSNSGVSQNISAVFAPSSSTVIDGNLVNLTYSGVSAQNLYPISMVEVSPGNYSGSVSTDFFIFSAETLDFTGRTIWVDNTEILRTKKLIVSNNPQPGYVLTCVNSEGMVEFQPVSASTSGTTLWSASTGVNAIVTEYSNSIASGVLSLAHGSASTASGIASYASGALTNASGNYSHAEGSNTTAAGNSSHSEGALTTASGYASHAEGFGTTAFGSSSHAEGSFTIAQNQYSHAEGSNTTAAGNSSHSEGALTTASGNNSHSEGFGTLASGPSSHAEGSNTSAIGASSHAEGSGTIASGISSHAEGSGTIASGVRSHASGFNTMALGADSYVGGGSSIASGDTSFVHGLNSVAIGDSTIVLGDNITGSTSNHTYVESLNIRTVGSTAFVNDIRIDNNGFLTTNTSDERLKENIEPISNALNKVKNLQGVTYQWKDRGAGGDDVRLGFIAQQVEDVEPLLVFTNKNSDYKSIHIDGVIPLLVEAIKELTNTKTNELIFETQTIAAEDNNIELNYNGTKLTSIGGGITIVNGVSDGINAEFKLNSDGNWITNNSIIPSSLSIPNYTPTSSSDNYGNLGEISVDDDYLYIKGNNGWKRLPLESF
jgi:hypothetical protein